jgi:hypothetical protein
MVMPDQLGVDLSFGDSDELSPSLRDSGEAGALPHRKQGFEF